MTHRQILNCFVGLFDQVLVIKYTMIYHVLRIYCTNFTLHRIRNTPWPFCQTRGLWFCCSRRVWYHERHKLFWGVRKHPDFCWLWWFLFFGGGILELIHKERHLFWRDTYAYTDTFLLIYMFIHDTCVQNCLYIYKHMRRVNQNRRNLEIDRKMIVSGVALWLHLWHGGSPRTTKIERWLRGNNIH